MAVTDVPSSSVAALLDACSGAVRTVGGCRLAPPAEGDTPSAVVSVLIDAATAQAHLQVTLLSAEPTVRSYDIRFRPSDSSSERFRAVGLAVASLVGDRMEGDPSARATHPLTPGPPAQAPSASNDAAPFVARELPGSSHAFSPSRWWLDGQVLVDRGATDGGPGLGAFVGAAYHFSPATPWIFALGASYSRQGALAYAASVGETRVLLGAGASTPGSARWGVDLRLHLLVDHLEVHGVGKLGASAVRQRWNGGLSAGITGICRLTDSWGIVAGFAVDWLRDSTEVTAYGENVLHIPAINGLATAGVRVTLR